MPAPANQQPEQPAPAARPLQVLVAATGLPEDFRRGLTAAFQAVPRLEVQFATSGDPDELVRLAANTEVLVAWRIPPAALAAAVKLKLWVFPGVGVQHLIEPLRRINAERPLTLVNSHANSIAVGQHTVGLLLALTNRLMQHHNWLAAGNWRTGDKDAASTLLTDKLVGLLGYGAINRRVQRLLAPFGVRFAALKRSWDPAEALPAAGEVARYDTAGLADFLAASDIVVVALPATPHTTGLLGAPELARLGPAGLLINVARGDIVTEEPLYQALRDGVIAGAALDVWYDYQPEPDATGRRYPYHFPFHELGNVVLSPHRAASPVFDLARWAEVVDLVRRYALGQPLYNVVELERGY